MTTKTTKRRVLDPRDNLLLAALPADQWQRWLPHLEPVDLPAGHVVYERGQAITHLYFPLDAVASLLYEADNGATSEIAMVGRDGVLGISLLLGVDTAPHRAVVQNGGRGVRLLASVAMDEFARADQAMRLMLSYTQVLIGQMSQNAVCNRHHSLDQQLCRWLLVTVDLLGRAELATTQLLIAQLMGVRRGGVAEAAADLQQHGLISYTRGHITVLDRLAMERRSCECYRVIKREYNRLLPGLRALVPSAP